MNYIQKILLSLLLAAMAACGQADKTPEGILSKEKMRDVLLDMNMADAYSYNISPANIPLPDSIRQQHVKVYYRQILDRHGISVKDFTHSYRFYEAHPDRLKQVYDMMLGRLAQERRRTEAINRLSEYAARPGSFFPYPKNSVISKPQDTIIPFLKKKK